MHAQDLLDSIETTLSVDKLLRIGKRDRRANYNDTSGERFGWNVPAMKMGPRNRGCVMIVPYSVGSWREEMWLCSI